MALLTAPTTLRYTPEDLLSMPENSGMELVEGRILEKRVSKDSSRVEGLILSRIQTFLFQYPLAEVYPATLGYTCFPNHPGMMQKPDVTVITSVRLNQLPQGDTGYLSITPDLAVEVISPNDVTCEMDQKIEEYQQAGFPLIWIADPKARTITVFPLNGRPVILTQDDEITAEAALSGFRCKVRDLFQA